MLGAEIVFERICFDLHSFSPLQGRTHTTTITQQVTVRQVTQEKGLVVRTTHTHSHTHTHTHFTLTHTVK